MGAQKAMMSDDWVLQICCMSRNVELEVDSFICGHCETDSDSPKRKLF